MKIIRPGALDDRFLREGRIAVQEIRNTVPTISENGEAVKPFEGLLARAEKFLYKQDLFCTSEKV